MVEHTVFQSPFTWRYGSDEMRRIFSEIHRRKLWRKVWLALAEAQSKFGLISQEELEDLRKSAEDIDIEKAEQIEREIGHDLVAELRTFAQQCPKGGGKLHLGATSMDIEDNADILRFREALEIVERKLARNLRSLAKLIEKYADLPCLGYTHLQPAEPTTFGYRMSMYAQELLLDLKLLEFVKETFLKGKGMKGAVGTSAAFAELADPVEMEKEVMKRLGIEAFPIASQTYPRKVDYVLLATLSSLAQSLYKMSSDMRHLQMLGEVMEPRKERQVGSSAMPFKRNPVMLERVCSLTRYVSALPNVAWENAAQSVLERTLDDSANRRIILPEAFLAIDECLDLTYRILENLVVNEHKISENLRRFAPFSALERIIQHLVKKGYNRQEMHEHFRKLAMKAWEEVDRGGENTLPELLRKDEIARKLENLEDLLRIETYVGNAPKVCREWVEKELLPELDKWPSS